MNSNDMIEQIKEKLTGRVIWLQSASDQGSEFAEGMAVTITDPDEEPDDQTFTVSYFRVYPSYEGERQPNSENELPDDCIVDVGYEKSWPTVEEAKAEALGLLPYLPKPGYLKHTKTDVSLTSLQKLDLSDI